MAVAVAAEAAVADAALEAAVAVVGVGAVAHLGDVVAGAKHHVTITLARHSRDRPGNWSILLVALPTVVDAWAVAVED